MIQCFGRVDDHRYLVGDTTGKLYMLFLHCEERMGEGQEEVVTELKLELLGEVSVVCGMGIITLGCSMWYGNHYFGMHTNF